MRHAWMSFACLLAALAGCWPITQWSADTRIWVPMGLVLLSITLVGLLLRLVRASHGLVQVVQVLVLAGWLVGLADRWTPLAAANENLLIRVGAVANDGLNHIREAVAPMPPNASAAWLLIALVGVIAILTEMFAITLEQPAWSLSAFAIPYLISALEDHRVTWQQFAALALAYVVLLMLRQVQTHACPQGLTSDSVRKTGVAGRAALGVGLAVPAIAVSLLAASVMPTSDWSSWLPQALAPKGPIQLGDPSLNLADNLNRPTNRPVLRYRTSSPEGLRLRLTALPKLSAAGASLVDVDVFAMRPSFVPPTGAVRVDTQVTLTNFTSQYLPVPYAPLDIKAAGSWGWEPNSMTVVARDDTTTANTTNATFSTVSQVFTPQPEAVRAAVAGRPRDVVTTGAIPADVPESIRELANQLTQGLPTDGAKAIAIQDFLRGPEFTYSTQAPDGAGYAVMEQFLFTDRSGFCIHYATSMAMLARIAAIPSRVAVGFLPGEQQADGTWLVTSHDMHAWPELYFAGLGWVSFEPTPAVAGAPTWAQPPASATPTLSTAPTSTPSSAPTATVAPTVAPTVTPTAQPQTTPQAEGGIRAWLFVWVGGALALLASPALLRGWLRRRRLNPRQALDDRAASAWRELRCLWADYGLDWASGSPRKAAAQLGTFLSSDEALQELALIVERSRFAETQPDPGDLTLLVQAIREDLGARSFTKRTKAALIPRSLLLGSRNTLG